MKNKLLKELFSKIVISPEKMNFLTWLKPKNRVVQLTPLIITVLAGFMGILLFSNYLIYTLLPLVWHWGFDSTITWQKSTINWKGFISEICSHYLILSGLITLVLISDSIHDINSLPTYNFEKHLNNLTKQLRPCLLSIEKRRLIETLKSCK